MKESKAIYAAPIPTRPPRSWGQRVHALIFFLVFNVGCLMINASQFVLLFPVCFLPFAATKSLCHVGIRLSKGAFGTLLSKSRRHRFFPALILSDL